MNGRVIKLDPRATAVSFPSPETLRIALADGRALEVPVSWSQRLAGATAEQRLNVQIIADGRGLHWPDVDEDIDVASLLKADELLDWPLTLGRNEQAASLMR